MSRRVYMAHNETHYQGELMFKNLARLAIITIGAYGLTYVSYPLVDKLIESYENKTTK